MSIAKQAFSTLVTKIISFIFFFIGSVFLTRLLGVEGKGVQAFIVAGVALFSTIFRFNILKTLTYFIAKDNVDIKAARGVASIITTLGIVIFTICIMILYYFESPLLNVFLPEAYQSLFFVIYLVIFFINSMINPFFNGNWQGQARFDIINSLLLLSSLLNAIFFPISWYLQEKQIIFFSLEKIFALNLILTVGLLLIRATIYIRTSNKISFSISEVVRPMLMFSIVGWSAGIMNFAIKRIDFWFVEYYREIEELGHYALAASLIDIFITLILPATVVISPYITRGTLTRRIFILGRFSRIAIAAMFIATILVLPLIKPLLPILYGVEFSKSVFPLQILIFGGFFMVIRNIFSVYNIATNNLKPNLYANLTALMFTIILDALLVPKYGMIGASWVSLGAYFLSSLIVFFSVFRKLDRPLGYFLFFSRQDYQYLLAKAKNSRLFSFK